MGLRDVRDSGKFSSLAENIKFADRPFHELITLYEYFNGVDTARNVSSKVLAKLISGLVRRDHLV